MTRAMVMPVAHRGASAYAPENTVAALDEAIRLGSPAVEFDVRLSSDGVPVVLHDETVDRTTSGHGPVRFHSELDLRRLDAGSWLHPRFAGTRIPTLDEALSAVAPYALPVIELKVPVKPSVLEALLRNHGVLDESLVLSFDTTWLEPIRKQSPTIQLGVLAEQWDDTLPRRCMTLGAPVLVLNVEALNLERIDACDRAGLEVWCYTANDVGLVAACAAMGVTGIITDRPDLIRAK